MGQTILTKDQEAVLTIIGNDTNMRDIFYLSGGTALAAFYLEHRYSDDLDFFTSATDFPQFVIERIAEDIRIQVGAEKIEYQRLYDRRIFFFKKADGELKVEFTQYPFVSLRPHIQKNNLQVDSLEDLAANKIMALIDRIEPKDFVDLYFLLYKNDFTLDQLCGLVEQKFHLTINPIILGAELAKVRLVIQLPRMLKSLTLEELKNFFTQCAKQLRPDIIM